MESFDDDAGARPGDGRIDLGPYLPFGDFAAAVSAVLAHLHVRHGMGLWMLTRTVGDEWVVLDSHEHHGDYGVDHGTVLRWDDSFCHRMVERGGPRVAPDSDAEPAYADAPIARQLPIGSYLGVPLVSDSGELFGTLCAVDPLPASSELGGALSEVELLGRLLMTVLTAERRATASEAAAARALGEARTDSLCGILNRRGWDDAVEAEAARCDRYGDVAGVVVMDLDGLKRINDTDGHAAGDRALRAAASALRGSVRTVDVVARTGGDEFAVLVARTDEQAMDALTARIRASLAEVGVAASVGCAVRDVRETLGEAVQRADSAMYDEKSRSPLRRDAGVVLGGSAGRGA